MEDMGAVLVYMDALHQLAVDIAPRMGAFVYHQAAQAGLGGFMGKDAAIEARPHNQVIILFFHIVAVFRAKLYNLFLIYNNIPNNLKGKTHKAPGGKRVIDKKRKFFPKNRTAVEYVFRNQSEALHLP
jgi:hypothetical protein